MLIECGIYKGQRMYVEQNLNGLIMSLAEDGIVGIYKSESTTWFDCPAYLKNKFNKWFADLASGKVEIITA